MSRYAGKPSTSRVLNECRLVALSVVALACAVPAAAQRSDLAEKLAELNVRHVTEHYALAGTVNDARLEEYGRALEWIYGEYAQGFRKLFEEEENKGKAASRKKGRRGKCGPAGSRRSARAAKKEASDDGKQQKPKATGILDRGEDERFPVIVFATGREYREFGREFIPGGTENSGGMYLGLLGVLLILDRPNADDTYSVLFHEAFHQFMCRHIKNPTTWLNEGLAVYYEGARPGRGGIRFINTRKNEWDILRKVIPTPEAIPLWRVVTASRPMFYDETPIHVDGYLGVHRKTLYYAEAYTLMHLLLSDPEGRERVQNYICDLAKDDGMNTRAITERYFDKATCDQLTYSWIRHVNSRR
ncbi:MAG TPA: hypothetical protein VM487_16400 [Phycisphaerae bacterium]|nr:hypothetical protein [Phycisphaerae bacterium]